MGKSGKSKSPKSGKGKSKDKDGKKKGKGKDLGKARTEAEEECRDGSLGPTCNVDANQAKTAILLLQSPEIHIVSESLVCLEKYCARRPENKVLFIDMGGTTNVKPLIYSENVLIQLLALKIMAITSALHPATILIRDFEMAKDLLEIANNGDGLYFVEYATYILSNLAMLFTGRLQIIQHAGVPILLHLLRHDDPDVQRNCADTLWRLAEEPLNVELMTNKDAVLSLLLLVESEYPSLQNVVLNILEKISMSEAGIQLLDSVTAPMILEKILAKPNNGDLHPVALRILKNLAANPEALKKVLPTTPALLRVLSSSPDMQTQNQAWEVLGVLVSDLNVTEALRNFGFLPQITEVLTSKESAPVHEAAVFCLYQLSRYDSFAKIEFLDGNAIPALVGYLNSQEMSQSGFETALLALSLFFNDSKKAMPPFISSKGFSTFKKFLDNKENYSADGLISLLTCIPKMTNFDEFKTECINEGFVAAISNVLISTEFPQLLVAGAHAICGLLSENQARQEFLDKDGFGVLTKLLSSNEYPVIVSAIPLIYMLAANADYAKSLIQLGLLQEMWKRQDLISRNGPLRTSFESLISKHLPIKYGFSGHIGPFERIGNGFYDTGSLEIKDGVPMLSDFLWINRDPQRKVIYLNWESNIPDVKALEQNASLQKVQNEDLSCHFILDKIREQMRSISSEKALVQAVAKAVSDNFGGPQDKWRVGAHAEELEVADLQTQHESVVIPITMISHASFRSRAIVFKAICDIFGIPCSLERGEYRKTWNVVLLQSKKLQMTQCPCEYEDEEAEKNIVFTERLRRFVVDLVYQPGTLLPVHSHEANSYCCH